MRIRSLYYFIRLRNLGILFILGFYSHISGQEQSEQGYPFITNYSYLDYNADPVGWWIEEDERGVLYFANQSGIQEYDGANWNLISNDNTGVRSLVLGDDNVMYVGMEGDLGYIGLNDKEQLYYFSLKDKIPEAYDQFETVWMCYKNSEGIWFVTNNILFLWDYEQFHILESEDGFHVGGVVRDKFYVRIWNKGLHVVENRQLNLVPNGQKFANERIYEMLPFGENRILVGSRSQGFFLYDGSDFTPFKTDVDNLIKQSTLYLPGTVLSDGNFAINTLNSGLLIIDENGQLIRHFNTSTGLQDNAVHFVFQDSKNNIWVALTNGISKINYSSPLSFYSIESGLPTKEVYSSIRYDGTFYAGTQHGSFYLDHVTQRFQRVAGSDGQSFGFVDIAGDLIAGSLDQGIYKIENNRAIPIRPSVNYDYRAQFLHRSKLDSTLVYVQLESGLSALRVSQDQFGQNQWEEETFRDGLASFSFVETSDGNLWLDGDRPGEVKKIIPKYVESRLSLPESEIIVYDQSHGLHEQYIFPFRFFDDLYFTDAQRTKFYTFNERDDQFVVNPSPPFASIVGTRAGSASPVIDKNGVFWADYGGGGFAAIETAEGEYQIISSLFKEFLKFRNNFIYPEVDENGQYIVWFSGAEGIVRYEGDLEESFSGDFSVLIRQITIGADSTIFYGNAELPLNPNIKFGDNTIKINYASPYYISESDIEYQIFLEGFDSNWSVWRKQNEKEYLNLSPGHYTFHVKAKNIYDQLSEEASFSFTIAKPWYSTVWAYLLYVIAGLSLIYAFVRWRLSQLKQHSMDLEKEVQNRTREIQQRVEELSVINSVQEALVEKLDLNSIYTMVGEKIKDVFDAQAVVINTFDHENQLAHYRYAYEKGQVFNLEPKPIDPMRKKLIDTGKYVLVNRDFAKTMTDLGAPVTTAGKAPKSALWVPLSTADKVIGSVSLQNVDHEDAFSENDVKVLSTLTNSMAVALENARLFEETNTLLDQVQSRARELSVINSVQEGLVEKMELDSIYKMVGEKIKDVFDAQAVVINMFDHNKNLTYYKYIYEKGKVLFADPKPVDGIRKRLIDENRYILINENFAEELIALGDQPATVGEIPKSALYVPLLIHEKVTGCISLQNVDHEHAFSNDDVNLLMTLTNSMAVALENARLFEESNNLLKEVQEQKKELELINNVQEGLVKQMETEGIFSLVGDKIRDRFNAQVVVINTFDEQNQIVHYPYSFEKGRRYKISEGKALNNIFKKIIATKAPLLVNEGYAEWRKTMGLGEAVVGEIPKSALWVPVVLREKVIGSVSLQNIDVEQAFGQEDVDLLSTLSNTMSVALQNTKLFEETRQRANEMGTVNSVSQALSSNLELDNLITMIGNKLQELFLADIVYIAMHNRNTNIINFPYQYGDNLAPLQFGEGLTSQIIKTKKSILLNRDLKQLHDELGIERIGIDAASYLGVPILSGKEVLGVLSVQSTKERNRFSESDMHLLETIAANVGIAIHNAQLFAEVEKSRAEAEDANEAKSAFLSTVSHELRTPLTSVLGFAKIIRKRLEEKIFPALNQSDKKMSKTVQQISENLDVVVSEGQRLTKLINEVLDLAKIESGNVEWHMEELKLNGVFERAISATNALFEQKPLKLKKVLRSDLPTIVGDEDKLVQVIVNLLSNAVKFTDKGEIRCKTELKNGMIQVSVQDSGIGISEEDLPKVFEKFKQVGDTLTDKPQGTGLGLPISKEIIEHHGGSIWVESELDAGSTFYFTIPFDRKSKVPVKTFKLDDLIEQIEGKFHEVGALQEKAVKKILVADDEKHIRELLNQELSAVGYKVNVAANGKEALKLIRRNRPDLVILDVKMPEMNGFDAAAVLKNDPSTQNIPIIILSIVEDKKRGYGIGIDSYLTKPIDMDELFKTIKNLLGQGKSRRKVMVVDEDVSTLNTLMSVLEEKGYQAVEANGKELMEKAMANKPDIIILKSSEDQNEDHVKSLRLEKGMENVLFLVYE